MQAGATATLPEKVGEASEYLLARRFGLQNSNIWRSDLSLTLDLDWGFGSSGRALMAYNSVSSADDRKKASERCSKWFGGAADDGANGSMHREKWEKPRSTG